MKNKELLCGTLLGDAWLYRDKKNFLVFAFSQANKEYATWKAQLLGYDFRSYDVDRFDKRTKKTYSNRTIYLNVPKVDKEELYSMFYTPKKTISKEILDSLSGLAICLWYLDDGNMYYNGNNCHLTLSVNSFSSTKKDMIINWFKENYDIEFKKSQEAIRLTSVKDCEKFMKIVEIYIPKSMEYKKLSYAISKHKS